MNDLLNDPTRPACGCDFGTSTASAWAVGPIVRANAAGPGDGHTGAVSA